MPHSLRAKLKYLTICGHIRKKDYERLCKALDNEGVLDKIRAEIEKAMHSAQEDSRITQDDIDCGICAGIQRAIDIIDKYKADTKYAVKVVARGNCMMCGKELDEGLFFCKECEAKIMQGRGEKKPCNLKPTDKYFQYSCCPDYREGFCKSDRKCAWESEEGKCTYYQDETESEDK